jgi:hypothetical protein
VIDLNLHSSKTRFELHLASLDSNSSYHGHITCALCLIGFWTTGFKGLITKSVAVTRHILSPWCAHFSHNNKAGMTFAVNKREASDLPKARILATAAVLVLAVLLLCMHTAAPVKSSGSPYLSNSAVPVHVKQPLHACNQQDPVALYAGLYHQFKDGLMETRSLAAKFCANTTVKPTNMPHYHHCLTGVMESELLYLRVRCLRPAIVTEVSSALGYSTLWILSALHHNKHGVLHSFDVFETQFPYVLGEDVRERWMFHKGNMQETFPPVLVEHGVDYVHIDTCHEDACVKMYLREVVGAVAATVTKDRPVFVSAHDMFDTFYSFPSNTPVTGSKAPLPEGILLLQWLSFSGTARHLHTVAAGVSNIGPSVQAARLEVLGDAASAQFATWGKWKGKDFSSSVYFELQGLDNMCKNCMPKE